MIIDNQPSSKVLPYELNIKINKVELTSKDAQIYPSFIEVFINNHFLDKTLPIIQSTTTTSSSSSSSSSSSIWNKGMSKKLMNIDNDLIITFGIYVKKLSTLSMANVSKVLTLGLVSNNNYSNNNNNNNGENILKCSGLIKIKDYYPNNYDFGIRDIKVNLITPLGNNGGILYIKIDIIETKLFAIQSILNNDTYEQLKQYIENNFSFNLKKNIKLIDNNNQDLLKIIITNLIEAKDILTEGDIYDIISESSYQQLQQQQQQDHEQLIGDKYDDDDDVDVPFYPCSKPKYSKLIIIPSSLDEKRNHNEIIKKNNDIMIKEKTLSIMNDNIEKMSPVISSVYHKDDIPMLAFDNINDNNDNNDNKKDNKNDYYEIEIICKYYDDDHDHSNNTIIHHLKWLNYLEYIHVLRELIKIQHINNNFKYLHEIPSKLPSPYTTKAFYNQSTSSSLSSLSNKTSNLKLINWKSISFTIDTEAEYLVVRDNNHSNHSSGSDDDVCNQLISFEKVSLFITCYTLIIHSL